MLLHMFEVFRLLLGFQLLPINDFCAIQSSNQRLILMIRLGKLNSIEILPLVAMYVLKTQDIKFQF